MANSLLLIGRIILSAVFGVAGIAKLADREGSRRSLIEFGVPPSFAPVAAWLLPVLELVCAVALLRGAWAWWGAIGALALLVTFVAGIAISMMRGRRPDCRCFGQLHSSPAGGTTLVRNAVLAGLAALIVWQAPSANMTAAVADPSFAASGFSRTVLILGIVIAGQSVLALIVLYHLVRQNGRMLLRLDVLEAKLGMTVDQPEAVTSGLPINSAAPRFSLKDLDGRTVTLDMLAERGKSLLFFFTEPGCGVCDAMLPDVAQWQREHGDRFLVIPIAGGDAIANRAKSRTHNLQHVLLEEDHKVSDAYRVAGTPSAVLVTDGLIASGLAGGANAIRALATRAALPPPLKKGDVVPSIHVRDLNGGTMDLATLKGRRTLLLFWNPSCGFCEAMLEDLKNWERNRPNDAPALVLISTGSPKANREQGFRSTVLLDAKFGIGEIFGAGGTPSAIVVDEKGRIATDVAVGAEAIFDLAGVAAVSAGNRR